MLKIWGFDGWGIFGSARPYCSPLHRRHRFTLSLDQGPDNLCQVGYILNKKRLRGSVIFSPTHKIVRCMFAAVEEIGKGSEMKVAAVIITARRAPFNTMEHGHGLREGLKDWHARMDGSDSRLDTCPILDIAGPMIAREQGMPHPEYLDIDQKREIWFNALGG